MLYSTFIYKAKELTLSQAENGVWYLEPEWQDLISRNIGVSLDELEDSYLSGWYDVEDILKLEAEKRNVINSKTKDVVDWLHDLITATVEPVVLEEETNYIKQVVEFMKANRQSEQDTNDIVS